MKPDKDGIYLLQQDLREPQWVKFSAGSWYPLDRTGEPYRHSPYEMLCCGWLPCSALQSEEIAALMERLPVR